MQDETTRELTPREFISACRDLAGDTYLVKLFGVGPRSIQRWVAQRPYVDEDSVRENPVEKIEVLLRKIMTVPGGPEVARSIVSRLAGIAGCSLDGACCALPDKGSIEAECLDDYPALVAFHDAIREGRSARAVVLRHMDARRELDETLNQYLRVRGGEE